MFKKLYVSLVRPHCVPTIVYPFDLKGKKPYFSIVFLTNMIAASLMFLSTISSASETQKNISTQNDNEETAIPLTLLPRDNYKMVDWAKAVESDFISPIGSLSGEEPNLRSSPKPLIIKSKMEVLTDVIFSHDVHSYWLNCENCHPSIFPEKHGGTEDLSMKAIFKGEFCGKCHDKVAFRLKECYRCHLPRNAKKKEEEFSRVNLLGKIYATKDVGKEKYKGVPVQRNAAKKSVAEKDALAEGRKLEDPNYDLPVLMRSKRKVMTDVLFSHKVHNEVLSCESCHNAIFAKKRGSTEGLSMAAINEGKFCGTCHGGVVFPLGECDRCHLPGKAAH
ncbi:MAG: hypothetical protein IME96_10605 [Proteobacteria bacterium]|nr:hypothetical protein [Pseudomonadota bacterium]